MKFYGIRLKLFTLTILILLPLITFHVFRIKSSYNQHLQTEQKKNEEISKAIATSFFNSIEELWSQEEVLSTYFTINPELPIEHIQIYLEEIAKKQETTLGFTWTDSEGTAIASSRKDAIGRSFKEKEYMQRIIAGEDRVVSDLENSIIENLPIVPVAMAVRSNGELKGIIVALLDVQKMAQRLPNINIGKESRYGFIDRKGMIAYRSDNNNIPFDKRRIADDSPSWGALKGEIVTTVKRISATDGTLRMGINYPIKEIGWDCFVSSSYDSVMAKHYNGVRKDVFIFLLLISSSILIALVFGNRLVKSIINLKENANKVMKGDYTARTNISGYDELSDAGQAFNLMAEEIEKVDRLKNHFFSNISHELKTPVNVIFASAQLLGNISDRMEYEALQKKVTQNVKVIRQNCYRLVRLISNLIDITRFDNGFIKMTMGNHDIIRVVEDITLSVVRYAETKGLNIIFDTEIEEKIVACDPELMERMILNLISNSIKFTDEGGNIYVTISCKDSDVVISVKDTGVGIPKEKLKVVFDRFEQVDTSLSRNSEGSGIGLSLVKAIVEAHKGSITAKSQYGEGAEFIITIPNYVLTETESTEENNLVSYDNEDRIVERIKIEFSDIYSIGLEE